MNLCRVTSISKAYKIIGSIMFITSSLLLWSSGLYLLLFVFFRIHDLHVKTVLLYLVASLLSLAMASVLCLLFHRFYLFETRRYTISNNGIEVSSKKNSYYEWSIISEVAIVAYGASASKQSYQPMICVFIQPKTDEVLKKLLHSYLFGIFNQRNFVLVDYTPLTIGTFTADYPNKIVDYRQLQLKTM